MRISPLRITFALAALNAVIFHESSAANITIGLSNRGVEAGSDATLNTGLGDVTASANFENASADQKSNIDLIGDILGASGEGNASGINADFPNGTTSAESDLFLEFTLASAAGFILQADTAVSDANTSAQVQLRNLSDLLNPLLDLSGNDSDSISGTLIAGVTYQLSAIAGASPGGDTATWSLNFRVAPSEAVPDAGSTALLLALTGGVFTCLRRPSKSRDL